MAELKMNRENVRRRELRKENSASVILKTLGLIHDDPRRLRALANYLEGR
jgi:hypothetical protein